MKKKLLWSVIILITSTIAITSCSNEDKDNPVPKDGAEAQLKISLKLPPNAVGAAAAGAASRADHEATTAESNIEDIYIFVFDQQGNMPSDPSKGKFALNLKNPAHFSLRNGTSNVYDMVNPVTTTSGIKTIYVVANMDENNISTVGTESQLLSRIEDVHTSDNSAGLVRYNGTMVSSIVFVGSKIADLNPISSGLGDNTVEVDIERSISRVITTSPASFTENWAGTDDMTFTILKFFVAQDTTKSYLGQNFFPSPNQSRVKTRIADVQPTAWNTVLDLYDPEYYITGGNNINDKYITIGTDPGSETQRATLPCFYIGENASNTPEAAAQHGNTTYAWIQTQLTTTASAAVSNGEVAYTGGPISPNTDFWVVHVNGVADYLCWQGNLDDVKANLTAKYPGNVVAYKYPKGYVYYRVFLNKVDENGAPLGPDDKYNVYRNQFIHLDIQGLNVDINKPGGFGGGYPGDERDLEVPIDPLKPDVPGGDPSTGTNPGPHDETDPIDEDDATLKVNITVKP